MHDKLTNKYNLSFEDAAAQFTATSEGYSDEEINDIKRKIALFCNVRAGRVIEAADASTIYEVPLKMLQEKLDLIVL
jgi:CTP synthase (UTP-ammonia lyase)